MEFYDVIISYSSHSIILKIMWASLYHLYQCTERMKWMCDDMLTNCAILFN